MTNADFYALMKKTFAEAEEIARLKGEDYTKGSADALANFKEGGKDIDLDPKKVLWIFMNKHYQAITNYVRTGGQSESEPIDMRLKDLINYCVLMLGIITEEKQIKQYPLTEKEAFQSRGIEVLHHNHPLS